MIHNNILDVIGNTPLVRLNRIARGLAPTLVAKLEFINPGGSAKDRIALAMVEEAERDGRLKPGGTIIEGTSGNTGMGLAMVAAVKGYRAIFTIPDKMSQEKIDALRALGAEVVVTPTAVPHEDPRSYHAVALRLNREISNSIFPNQYDNPNNPLAHYQTTGPELWEQTDGKLTHVVIGIGTGGTISGVGRYLKERSKAIRVIGVDPVGSIFYETFHKGANGHEPEHHPYKVEGVGQDALPHNVDFGVMDDIIQVTDRESFNVTRALARQEGIFAGGSSGMALAAAFKVARTAASSDLIVVVLPDSGARYLSKIYNDSWMRENQFLESPLRMSVAQVLAHKDGTATGLITVTTAATIGQAIELMRAHSISQVPVVAAAGSDRDGAPSTTGQVLGSLDENHLLGLLLKNADAWHHNVLEFMQPPLPEAPEDTPIDELTPKLQGCNAILVRRHDASLAILTRSDLLFTLFKTEMGAG